MTTRIHRLVRPSLVGALQALAAALALSGTVSASTALGQTADDAGSPLAAIQQRQFRMDHEIDISVGWLPLDPFTKTLMSEISYTYHLSDQLAWEVFRVSCGTTKAYCGMAIETGLRTQAEKDFNAPASSFEEYWFGASTSLELAPAYGKFSLMNDNVLHAEVMLDAGPMVALFSDGLKIGPIGGIGLRVFANEAISVRFDARYGFLIGRPSTFLCTLDLGVSFDFGHAD